MTSQGKNRKLKVDKDKLLLVQMIADLSARVDDLEKLVAPFDSGVSPAEAYRMIWPTVYPDIE